MRRTSKTNRVQEIIKTDNDPELDKFRTYLENGGIGNIKHQMAALRERGVPFAQSFQDEDAETIFVSSNNSNSTSSEIFKKRLRAEFEHTLMAVSLSQSWIILKKKRSALIDEMTEHYEKFVSKNCINEDDIYKIIFKVMNYHGYEIQSS